MTTRVHRLEVDQWPTEDGGPWARYYAGEGHYDAGRRPAIPAWLHELLGRPEVQHRCRYDDDGRLLGVVMPTPHRRTYVSASGIQTLARDMRAFGAVVRVHTSQPVVW